MYFYAFIVVLLAICQVQATSILREVRDISNNTNKVWTKVRNQTIIDPDRNVKQPEPLSDMLQHDLSAIDEIAKNMYRKVKTAIMCHGLRYFMPIIKLSTLVFVTVMSNRENTESSIRDVALDAAKKAPTLISDKMKDIIPNYLPAQSSLGQEFVDNFKNEMDNQEQAHEYGSLVSKRALEGATEGMIEEAIKKEAKLASAKIASLKAKEIVGATKFNKDLLKNKFVRKTADEKKTYKDQFKKKPDENPNENDEVAEEDIESMLTTMVNDTNDKDKEESQKMFSRVAGKSAMKSRKNVIRNVIDTAIEAILTAMDNIESWTNDVEVLKNFFQELRANIKNAGRSKVVVLETLQGVSDPMLDLYYKECDCNLNVKIYEEFDKKIAQAMNEEGEHSIAELMSNLNVLSINLQQELNTLPVEWKNSTNFELSITGS